MLWITAPLPRPRRRSENPRREWGSRRRRASMSMSEMRGTDTELMPVSIVAGPAANALLARVKVSPGTIIEQPDGANPDEIIERITSLAAQPGVEGLIIQCETERPPMAYASLFAGGVAKVARLQATTFAIEVTTFLTRSWIGKPTRSQPAS